MEWQVAIPLEMQIRDLFSEYSQPQVVTEELSKSWERNLFSPDEQRAAARFLLRNSDYTKFCSQLARLIATKQKLPWAELAYAIELAGLTLTNEEKRALTEGVSEQEAYEEVLEISSAVKWDPLFEKKNVDKLGKISQDLIQKKEFIKEKIQYFRSQRMYREEAAAIDELRAIDPNDESIPADQRSVDERWAYDVVAQGATERDLLDSLNKKVSELTDDQKKMKKVLVANAKKQLKKHPEQAYDLALHLHFMEFHGEAIEILESSGKHLSEAELWLRLELMIKSRRFIEALDETHNLEERFADQPDSVFAAIYARSICLWELNQGPLAVELLKSIVRIRPGYRSAHSLLTAWTGGDF
jgi:hypothetical protein